MNSLTREWLAPLALLFVVLLAIPAVHAIGISPGRVQTDFAAGERRDLTVTLLNNAERAVDVEVRVAGILDGRVAVPEAIRIPARGSTTVPLSFTMPDKLAKPGLHTSYIYFAERVPDDQGGTFAVRTEVGIAVILWQPYPGQYAEIVASAPSVAEGEDTKLKLLVSNLGSDAIENGKATVRVVSADGALQDVFSFPNVNVPGNSNKDYYDRIPSSGYVPGKYALEAKLVYGVNVTEMKGSFAVGTQDVEPLTLEGPFYLDKPLNRYTLHVESLWNLPLENVYATVLLGSTPSTTSPIQLGGFERGVLQGFWETDASVKAGQSVAKVTVFYPGGTREELLPVTVYNETPQVPVYEEPSAIELSGADFVFMILVVIAVVLIVLFVIRRFRDKGEPTSAHMGAQVSAQPAPKSASNQPLSNATPAPQPPKSPGAS
jgi:hypothetical protein